MTADMADDQVRFELRELVYVKDSEETSESGEPLPTIIKSPCVTAEVQAGTAVIHNVLDENDVTVRVLEIGGAYQSCTYLGARWHEPVLEYYRAFDHVFEASIPVRDVLMIGGGGCSYPKHALMQHADLRMDVVEVDPAIAKIARKYFFVDQLEDEVNGGEGGGGEGAEGGEGGEGAEGVEGDRFRLIISDGVEYLATCEKRYDAILNDCFVGDAADEALARDEGIRAVKARLTPGGLYLINFASDDTAEGFAELVKLMGGLRAHFAQVAVILAADEDFGGEDNYVVIASDGDHQFSNTIPYSEEIFD